MKTTEEKIEVMQAYVRGKAIQIREFKLGGGDWKDVDCRVLWNWERFDYRIKPQTSEGEYRPYKNDDEVIEDSKLHGGYFRPCEYICWCKIVNIAHNYLTFIQGAEIRQMTFNDMFKEGFRWYDNSIFGRKND